MNNTIHECHRRGKDVNKSLILVHCADTLKEALEWLSDNGGGVYRCALSKIKFDVAAGEYKSPSAH